jgi:acylaminoacyl-peptidase
VIEEKGDLDKERIHIYGRSYGGFMSAIMGSRFPTYFKSAIIVNGVISYVGNFWSSDIPEWSTVEALSTEDYHKLTAEDYVKMHELSAISEGMKIPTLQLLGAKDRRVPFRQGLLFDAITRKQGNPIKTYVYEDGHHSLEDTLRMRIDSTIKIISFIEGIL